VNSRSTAAPDLEDAGNKSSTPISAPAKLWFDKEQAFFYGSGPAGKSSSYRPVEQGKNR
jgi:hypothetical protein